MLRLSLHLFLVAACATLAVLAADQPVVETSLGKVKGTDAVSRDGRKYFQFLGIPYGKAERFQPPTKGDSWTDVRDATKFGSVCPQVELKFKNNDNPKFIGSEDCLNVNVYTTKLPEEGKDKVLLPVLVWFTSGGFIAGSGNYYGAKYFMDTDVILVTINSRVGPFGFLNLGHEGAAGNQGLKDQVAALKWVQENIENFGGDKGRVTIFGHGSGGADVHYHLMSKLSKGLFHNAISQTGGSFAPWALAQDPIKQAKRFGERAGCPLDTKENLIACLKGKKTEEFDVKDYWWLGSSDQDKISWRPSVESVNTDKAFLTQNPFILMGDKKVENKVPLIIGVNDLDGAIPILKKFMEKPDFLAKINKDFDTYVPTFLGYKNTATDVAAVNKKIKDYYFEGKDITEASKFRITDVVADRFFFYPALNFAIKYSGIAPTYTYVNTNKGQYSHFQLSNFKTNGSAYYDDIQYEFPLEYYETPEITKESKDYEFSKNMINLWSSFAENGKPTKTWGTEKTWEKFDPAKTPITCYGLNPETTPFVVPQDHLQRHALWGELYGNILKSEQQDPPKETF